MTVISTTLLHHDLMPLIAMYQNGFPEDLLQIASRWNNLKRTRRQMAWQWAIYLNNYLNERLNDQEIILRRLCHYMPDKITTKFIDIAAERGEIEILSMVLGTFHFQCTIDAMDAAAREGHLEVVRFLHEGRHGDCSNKAMDGAASNGHLSTLEYLFIHRSGRCTSKGFESAASHGHLDVVRFLLQHNQVECTSQAIKNAEESGHLKLVEFLKQFQLQVSEPDTGNIIHHEHETPRYDDIDESIHTQVADIHTESPSVVVLGQIGNLNPIPFEPQCEDHSNPVVKYRQGKVFQKGITWFTNCYAHAKSWLVKVWSFQ